MCREGVRPKSPHYSWLIKPFSGGDHPEASMLFPYQLFLPAQLDLGFWCKRSALKLFEAYRHLPSHPSSL